MEEEIKMEEKETFIEQEKKFLKGLLEKYRSENPKEEINLEEEIKRMEEEDPSIIERAEEFFENLSFEEKDDLKLVQEYLKEKSEGTLNLKPFEEAVKEWELEK
jgi:hypothetical protein